MSGGGDCSAWDEANPPDPQNPDDLSILDFLDGQNQSQEVMGATFVLERVADNITCDQVRAHNFAP